MAWSQPARQATSHYPNQWQLVYWRIYASLGLNELTVELDITQLPYVLCFPMKGEVGVGVRQNWSKALAMS